MSLQTYKANSIKATKDHVLVKDMDFAERLSIGGIIIPSDDGRSEGIRPRWGEVIAVGPRQKDVKVGEWVLVAHGRWTRVMTMEIAGEEIALQRVDPNDIYCVSDEKLEDESWSMAVVGDNNVSRIEGSVHNHAGGGLTE